MEQREGSPAGRDDRLVKAEPLLKRVGDRGEFVSAGVETEAMDRLQRHERTGRAGY